MNPDDLAIGSLLMEDNVMKVVTGGGISATMPISATSAVWDGTAITTANAILAKPTISEDDMMDQWIMNRVAIDHKVQEQELMKLKETAPDYAQEIKDKIAREMARDVTKKITFTKKHDKDADVHHFIGRCWVFTDEEMKAFIKEIRNV